MLVSSPSPSRRRLVPPVLAAVVLGVLASLPGVALAAPGDAAAPGDVAAGDTVVGELVQGYGDPGPVTAGSGHPDDEGTGLLSWVRTEDGDAVRVPTEDVDQLDAGATVAVTVGAAVRDEASADGLQPARDVLAAEQVAPAEQAPTAPAVGTINHQVTVVMLQPAGTATQRAADPTTLAEVVDAVNTSVADFWSQQTGGAVRLGVVGQVDWSTTSVSCSTPFDLWEAAAGKANWQPGPGRHLLVYVPYDSPGCAYGLGTIGGSLGEGGLAYVQGTATSVIAHEFGHNLGLGHSSEAQCNASVDAGTCRRVPYGDRYDVMGVSWEQVGSLALPQLDLLGLATPAGSYPELSAWRDGRDLTLAPLSTPAADGVLRGAELVDVDGSTYWLEYRRAAGQDAWLDTAANRWPLQSGVVLHTAADDDDTSVLLDGTPSASTGWDADGAVALPVGTAVRLAGGRFTVTVTAVGDSGATVRVATVSPIDAFHRASGGDTGPLGPRTGADARAADGSWEAPFRNGHVAWTRRTGAHAVLTPLLPAWTGARADLGAPTSERYATTGGGFTQAFQRGRVHWSPGTGAHAVLSDISTAYDVLRGESGVLGYPTSDRYATTGGGFTQAFQRGRIHWSPGTGAHAVYADISRAYDMLRGESGVLGYPTSDRYATPGGGFTQAFQRGRIHWSSATGAHAVYAEISTAYDVLRGESGALGYPTSDRYATPGGGFTQAFQHGRIHWSPATGAHAVLAPLARAYDALRGESGVLGYPTSDRYATAGGGWTQAFQRGRIHWSSATGAFAVYGQVSQVYDSLGGESGRLGYPKAGQTTSGTTVRQVFQRGVISISSGTVSVRYS